MVETGARHPRDIIAPALDHLIRLEAYFRINELPRLAEGLDQVLLDAEKIMTESAENADGIDDARRPNDQDQQPCSAA